ncbi:MAG: beta-galactosidase [Anaerolineae bacterium]
MPTNLPMQFPYGAVYFRKSNPPAQDWERDYRTTATDGMNIFRHWFLWGSIEVAPGVFDWADYDHQLELADKYGIKTIAAEMMTSVPEWLCSKYPHLLYRKSDGSTSRSMMSGGCATGGFGAGPCLDHPQARELAGNFLARLVERYKDHPALLGYDIMNECVYGHNTCYCPATLERFREWLQRKYGDLPTLNKAWYRYSFVDWSDVMAPPTLAIYPECMDWLTFRRENYYAQMQWRVDVIRSLDQSSLVTAHGIAASITDLAQGGVDDWTAASKVQVYGFTWVASRKGSEPWKQWHAVDLVRAATKDKPFWHTEAQGGPLWLQTQVVGRARDDGRISTPEDVRIWNLTSLAAGARGLFFVRWRPLLDGPLFGAFGPYAMDGSRTPCSNMASTFARWTNDPAQSDLFNARPIKGDIGILFVPETEIFSCLIAQEGAWDFYAQMMWGAYRAFFDKNIQADWVALDDIDAYDILYFPYPIMLPEDQAARLQAWVKAGGTLICEGCPAYFGGRGSVGQVQPNLGFDELFGARQQDVEFTPDILRDLVFTLDNLPVRGGTYIQTYTPTTGTACGCLPDGRTIAVRNHYGQGRTLLIGTFPSEAYHRTSDANTGRFFESLLSLVGKEQHVTSSDSHVKVRLHAVDGRLFMWALNMAHAETSVEVTVSSRFGEVQPGTCFWGTGVHEACGKNRFRLQIPGKDAVILELRQV